MTPKEAAIAAENLLRDAGYTMDSLAFREVVGLRVAVYSFSDGSGPVDNGLPHTGGCLNL